MKERNKIRLRSSYLWKVIAFLLFAIAATADLVGMNAIAYLSTAGAFFFVVYALIITATRPFAGRIFDARGENAVMYPSFVFLTLGLLMLSFTNGSFMLLFSGALIGLGYGTFMSNGQAVCLKLVDSTKVGIALSTYFIGLDLGLGFGPYALGTVHGILSYRGIYILCAVITIGVTVLYAMFYKGKEVRVLKTKTSR